MNFFEKEMLTLFGDNGTMLNLQFIGKTMFGKLGENKLCKLQFTTTGTFQKYTAIQATIIDSNNGVIDKQLFKFSDIIGNFISPHLGDIEPHIWEYKGKAEWYANVTPTQKAKIADTVLKYVEMFQDRDFLMGMQF